MRLVCFLLLSVAYANALPLADSFQNALLTDDKVEDEKDDGAHLQEYKRWMEDLHRSVRGLIEGEKRSTGDDESAAAEKVKDAENDAEQLQEYKRWMEDLHRSVRGLIEGEKRSTGDDESAATEKVEDAENDAEPPTRRDLPCHSRHGCVEEGKQMVKRFFNSLFDQQAEITNQNAGDETKAVKRCLPWEACADDTSDGSDAVDSVKDNVARAVEEQLQTARENAKRLLDINARSLATALEQMKEKTAEKEETNADDPESVKRLLDINARAVATALAQMKVKPVEKEETPADNQARVKRCLPWEWCIEVSGEEVEDPEKVEKREKLEEMRKKGLNDYAKQLVGLSRVSINTAKKEHNKQVIDLNERSMAAAVEKSIAEKVEQARNVVDRALSEKNLTEDELFDNVYQPLELAARSYALANSAAADIDDD